MRFPPQRWDDSFGHLSYQAQEARGSLRVSIMGNSLIHLRTGEELCAREGELLREARVDCICPRERLNFYPSILGSLPGLLGKTHSLRVIQGLVLAE